ncbi:DNase I-like protein [Gigaspora margarita]|uniref:phosphoinositide 5-phosphatase n=1 Tax=Gigaspora margarita TaxID=4874 RepID=A0A8H4A468_GIGMA|nr:DNase I-like protein [Gigaspora margarita]
MQEILFRDYPRSIALRQIQYENNGNPYGNSNPLLLLFDQVQQSYNDSPLQCNVRLLRESDVDIMEYRQPGSRAVYGCLGLLQVEREMFLAVVTECLPVGEIRPNESVFRIIDVEFHSLTNNARYSISTYASNRTFYDDNSINEQSSQQQSYEHPCTQLRKLLSNGHFYFSSDFDLTKALNVRSRTSSADKYTYDDHFLWNKFMINELLNFRSKLIKSEQEEMDACGFLVLAIQGYVGIQETMIGSSNVTLSLISKLSCKRAGTRFNIRGIDDDGNVANFVETETILKLPEACFSYIQIRGSVPVFWEQPGLQVMSHKIQISRGPAATQPAVERHFNELQSRYGDIQILNLLGTKEGEYILSKEYQDRIIDLNGNGLENRVLFTDFDFNSICKNGNYENMAQLFSMIGEKLEYFAFFALDKETNSPIFYQKGVFRTNCMDCLDRTNVVQTALSKDTINTYIRLMGDISEYDIESLQSQHSILWAENGDSLSKIYTGTGALRSEYTRSGKVTWAGVLTDATKTVNRFYINNFQDKSKQEAIDLLLGKLLNSKAIEIHDPVNEAIREDILSRLSDYCSKSTINVFVGTYNLNGRLPSGESLSPWLFTFSDHEPDPHLFVIGFQEIVELKAQQIVSADPEKLRIWEKEISKALNSRPGQRSNYVILRSGQLVGTALVIYARSDIVSNIRNVEYVMKKMGLGGMAGNKGAVAIRLDYHDTSVCFVTAHFASGQSNFEDRNRDYHTVNDGLIFRNGRRLLHHEYVVFFGDFNYRINLGNEEARDLIYQENFDQLLKFEQLTNQISYGLAFTEYIEGPITFFPTYKYDNGTDEYDTSEKARTPAWTDRILYRGNKIRQIGYSRAELRVSDHRPVMSSFDIEVIKCDEAAKKKIQGELYVAKQKTMSRSIEKQTALSILESVEKTVHSISGNGEKRTSRSQFNDVVITNGDNELGKANYARKFNNPPDDQDNITTTDNSNISKETGPAVGLLINVDESNKKEELPPPSSDTFQWWTDYKGDSSSPMVVDKSVINRKYRNFSSNPFYELNPRLIRSMSLKPLIPSKSTTSKSVIRHNSLGSILRTNTFTEDDDEFLAKTPKFGDLTSSAQRGI